MYQTQQCETTNKFNCPGNEASFIEDSDPEFHKLLNFQNSIIAHIELKMRQSMLSKGPLVILAPRVLRKSILIPVNMQSFVQQQYSNIPKVKCDLNRIFCTSLMNKNLTIPPLTSFLFTLYTFHQYLRDDHKDIVSLTIYLQISRRSRFNISKITQEPSHKAYFEMDSMFSNNYNRHDWPGFDFELNSTQFLMGDDYMKNFDNLMADDHPEFSHDHMQHHELLAESRNDKDFFRQYDSDFQLPPAIIQVKSPLETKQLRDEILMKDNLIQGNITDYDHLGSRSTSEKSSDLSSKRFVHEHNQYIHGFQPEIQIQPISHTTRGRTLKNPIHQDFIYYHRSSRNIQVSGNQPRSKPKANESIQTQNSSRKSVTGKIVANRHLKFSKKQEKSRAKQQLKMKNMMSNKQKLNLKRAPVKAPIQNNMIQGKQSQNKKKSVTSSTDKSKKVQIISPIDRKKTQSQLFNIQEVIVSSELTGRIDTTNWRNQANIVTPDFKRAQSMMIPNKKSLSRNETSNQLAQSSSISTEQSISCSPQQIQSKTSQKKNNSSCQRNLSSNFRSIKNIINKACPQQIFIVEDSKFDQIRKIREKEAQKNLTEQEESEEELTDDECYLNRHQSNEKEEIQRYNIGLDKKHLLQIQSVSSQKIEVSADANQLKPKQIKSKQQKSKDSSEQKIIEQKSKKSLLQKRKIRDDQQDLNQIVQNAPKKAPKTNLNITVPMLNSPQYNLRRNVGKIMDDNFVYEKQINIKKTQQELQGIKNLAQNLTNQRDDYLLLGSQK
ncbi:UNKNOWN [Stylonychia lemnae]|uniref:Uncharacterized protein n=1 Tax=Stylonychia lemnae TaxID=5949 RepID=A0A078AIP7_STYLE|nr:UNKNOWN [Stylonychia lemnae]|eukprot:CDW81806.1 UNKNOWN [Stylonychia lemnae]